jgi:hypothetical protein
MKTPQYLNLDFLQKILLGLVLIQLIFGNCNRLIGRKTIKTRSSVSYLIYFKNLSKNEQVF